MLILHVHIHVKPERIDDFIRASIENASNSIQEPGIERFDLLRQNDDPARFMLVEIYRNTDAPARHRETAHYAKWRDSVADMMAEPRIRFELTNLFPSDGNWTKKD